MPENSAILRFESSKILWYTCIHASQKIEIQIVSYMQTTFFLHNSLVICYVAPSAVHPNSPPY